VQITQLEKGVPWQDQAAPIGPDKSVCIVRYGGFGDMIQMSSVLPWFKDNGWHITVNTTPAGLNIIKTDPHVDAVILQEHDQVPNQELTEYWARMAEGYTKFVQFSESIEGNLLALPGRPQYEWSTKKRHLKMNRDYFATMHNIAGVPLPPRPGFYPTADETHLARFYRRCMGIDSFMIMWALSGSSVHKAWPYTDQVIARLMMDYPDVHVVFVGDRLCQLLEDQWRTEDRVHRESGRMPIRDTLALAHEADMVVGPETGVLNCVAYTAIPKVIMLSHSSPANIGNSWINTDAMTPRHTPCYPCHKLHYGWSTCNRDGQTGGASCAANISADRVYRAIKKHLPRRAAA